MHQTLRHSFRFLIYNTVRQAGFHGRVLALSQIRLAFARVKSQSLICTKTVNDILRSIVMYIQNCSMPLALTPRQQKLSYIKIMVPGPWKKHKQHEAWSELDQLDENMCHLLDTVVFVTRKGHNSATSTISNRKETILHQNDFDLTQSSNQQKEEKRALKQRHTHPAKTMHNPKVGPNNSGAGKPVPETVELTL